MTLMKSDAKFEEKRACGLENDTGNLAIFSPDHLKVSKLGLSWDPFVQRRKCLSLKFTAKLCVTTIKNDAKFKEELTGHFKILTLKLLTLKNMLFNWILKQSMYNVWAKKSTEELCLIALKIDAKFERKLTCASKNDTRNW